MKPNVNILELFKHFERVEEKRAKKLSCVYASLHKLARLAYETSPILILMGNTHTHTHTIFELFQEEFTLFLALSISTRHEFDFLYEYVITKAKHE
jgi:hypothetical protein